MDLLEKLQANYRVCDETGCWIWTGSYGGHKQRTPHMHLPGTRQDRRQMSAYRVSWIVMGRPLEPGKQVFRTCPDYRCINPDHCKAGTPQERWAFLRESGRWRGDPTFAARAARARSSQLISVSVVRRVEELLAEGWTRKQISAEVGIDKGTVTRIRQKRHPHAANRVTAVRGASVFSLAG